MLQRALIIPEPYGPCFGGAFFLGDVFGTRSALCRFPAVHHPLPTFAVAAGPFRASENSFIGALKSNPHRFPPVKTFSAR